MTKWIGKAHESGTEEAGRCDTLVDGYGYEVAGVYETSRGITWWAQTDGGAWLRGTGGSLDEARTLANRASRQ